MVYFMAGVKLALGGQPPSAAKNVSINYKNSDILFPYFFGLTYL